MAAFLRAAHERNFNERILRRERIFRERCNPLTEFTDGELYSRYRFDRNGVLFITDLIRQEIESPTERSCAIPAEIKVLIAPYGRETCIHSVGYLSPCIMFCLGCYFGWKLWSENILPFLPLAQKKQFFFLGEVGLTCFCHFFLCTIDDIPVRKWIRTRCVKNARVF